MSTDLTFLTTGEIKDQAPVIFAGGPTREVSKDMCMPIRLPSSMIWIS